MTEETGADAPVDVQAVTAPAENQQPTPKVENADEASAPENTETHSDGNVEGVEAEAKRQSRSERYKRKISAQAGVIERIEAERQELARKVEELTRAKATDTAPNPADFPEGEYSPAYQAKLAAHEAIKAVSARLDEREKKDTETRQRDAATSAQRKLDESAAKVRERVPDFDQTLKAFLDDGGEFSDNVKRAIQSSGERGPVLAYQLAKNPDLADRLNNLSAEEVFLEMGELRAKASLPTPKATQARPPLTTPTGGASPPTDLASLAKSDDVTAYWEARKQQMKRAGA